MTDNSEQEDGLEWAVTWAEVGRELLRGEMIDCRFQLEDAFRDIEETLYETDECSGEVTHEQVRQLRIALNKARHHVENHLAPVAGAEPWGDPAPRVPMGVLWELTDHPKAEGVDPLDYVNNASAPEESEQQ